MKRLLAALILVTLTWSCTETPQSILPTTPTPTPTPTPSGPPLTISGVLVDKTSGRPLEGIVLDAVFLGAGMSTGPGVSTATDANGMFSISSFPASSVTVRVIVNDARYVGAMSIRQLQPGDTRFNFELERRITYRLSGVTFEETPNGPLPVEGVLIEAWACELNCAVQTESRVTTDREGRYTIPGMWAGVPTGLWLTRAGYTVDGPRPAQPCDLCDRLITASVDTQLDVALVRK